MPGWRVPLFKHGMLISESEPFPGTPADFGRLIAEESKKWDKVIRVAGIKPE